MTKKMTRDEVRKLLEDTRDKLVDSGYEALFFATDGEVEIDGVLNVAHMHAYNAMTCLGTFMYRNMSTKKATEVCKTLIKTLKEADRLGLRKEK